MVKTTLLTGKMKGRVTFRRSFVSAGRQNVRGKNPNWKIRFQHFYFLLFGANLSLSVLEHQSVIVLPQPVLPPYVERSWRHTLANQLSTRRYRTASKREWVKVWLWLQRHWRHFARAKVHDSSMFSNWQFENTDQSTFPMQQTLV